MSKKITLYGPNGVELPHRKKAGPLYGTPNNYPNAYRQRFYVTPTDTSKAVTAADRNQLISISREMFAKSPNINGAITQKANWAFGSAWVPVYTGENKEWGKQAVDWLVNQWFPICNVRGNAFDFRTSLLLSSISIDTDGDQLMVLIKTQTGYPLIQFISAHRIGCRNIGDTVVQKGMYKGLRIVDGVILNINNRPVAYRILGDSPEQDFDISAKQASLIVEPTFPDQVRGIPKLAVSVLDSMDLQDIEEFIKRQIKIQSTIGLIHSNEDGEAPEEDTNIITAEELSLSANSTITSVPASAPAVEYIGGGEIYYMKAGEGDLKPFSSESPSPNTADHLSRIERRILYSLGWPIELLDPSKVGGASVRLITDLARQSISQRQTTIEKRARLACSWAVSKAMELGILSDNSDDRWWSFEFQKPSTIVVDSGYERNADINDLKMGVKSMSEISSKYGGNWVDTRIQTQTETEDLIQRALDLKNKYPEANLSFDGALNLLSQRSPNPPPSNNVTPPETNTTKQEDIKE